MNPWRGMIVGMIGVMLLCPALACAAEPPNIEELFAYLHIDKAQKQKLMAGEILSTPVDEGSDKELAVGVAMFLPAPVEKLVDFVKNGNRLTGDKSVISFDEIKSSRPGEPADASSFSGVKFEADQTDEAKALLDASAGSKFNLSTDDIAVCRSTKSSSKSPEAVRAAAATACQKILLNRYQAFFKSGLNSIAPYDRGGKKTASPGDELKLALNESALFGTHFPELKQALLEYPRSQPEGVVNRFFWINQRVEKRPTFILVHRMAMVQPGAALMVEQQFYVGHSFNSMQVMSGCLAVPGGCVLFHSNHTSTDQVAGFGSGLRHSIGRDQMRDETIEEFKSVRDRLKEK